MSSAIDGAEADEDAISKQELLTLVQEQRATIERLEDEVEDLRERVDENAKKKVGRDGVNLLLDELLGGGIEDFTADPFEHREQVAAFNDRFSDIENTVQRHDSIIEEQGAASGDDKDVHWWNIVDAAQNAQGLSEHTLPNNWVLLFADDMAKATSVGERRCSQLIEEFAEEKEGVELRPYERIPSSRTTEGATVQRKAIKIDLDVWGEDDE